MKTCTRRGALAAMVGCLALLALGADVLAQEKEKEKTKNGYQVRSVVRLGYTRPGYPDDKLNKDGSIRQVAWDDQYTGKILGGTVYFMVLERTGTEGDTWGAGMADIDGRFVAGKNRQGQYSPKLDRQAKYIYLYQLVNDRGMEIPTIIPAKADRDLNVLDIAGTSLNLQVDPRYITSWGYFKGTGFVATVPERDIKGVSVAAVGGKSAEITLAVSSNRSIIEELPEKAYKFRSPSYSLKKLENTFTIGAANLNLKASAAYKQVSNVATPANYEANFLKAADNVKEPDYVSILYAGTRDRLIAVEDPDETNPILAVFRADWKEKETFVKLGFHSVVFGFTSDLPPTDETIRIEDPDAARRLEMQRQPAANGGGRPLPQRSRAQQGAGVVPAAAVAPGTAPTPTPPAGGGVAAPVGLLGGAVGGLGGGGGGAVPALAPTVGLARAFSVPGGLQGQGRQAEAQAAAITINFTPTLTNTQSQSQSQSQSQTQTQAQAQVQLPPPVKPPKPERPPPCHCPPKEVIPEPAAIVLGLLGLPAVYWIRRRRAALEASA